MRQNQCISIILFAYAAHFSELRKYGRIASENILLHQPLLRRFSELLDSWQAQAEIDTKLKGEVPEMRFC